MESLIAVLVVIVFLFMGSVTTVKKLEEKKIVPIIKHPYTGKKDNAMILDFARAYLFLGLAVIFLISGNFTVMWGFLVVTVFQIIWITSQIKVGNKPRDETVIVFNEQDQLEWAKYFEENIEFNDKGKVGSVKKMVLLDDTLYFAKSQKVLLKEKMYQYIYINKIVERENTLTFEYGFMGAPMYKRHIYIPNSKKEEFKKLLDKMRKDAKINRKLQHEK